jgi:TolB protein
VRSRRHGHVPLPGRVARGWRRILLAGVVSAGCLVPAIATGSGAAATASLPGGEIVFASNRADGHYQIYLMRSDGTGLARLTNSGADDMDPAFSPDGRQIAFASMRDGNWEIYVMDSDGSNQHRLTTEARSDRYPAWSPDGSKIAFSSARNGGKELYLMNPDGTGQTRVTQGAQADQPTWSPDSKRLAFMSIKDKQADGVTPNEEIYAVNVDGTGLRNLTQNAASDRSPQWSPNGTFIAFRRLDPTGQGRELYAMFSDGSTQRNLTDILGAGRTPAWSPDQKALVFVSYRTGHEDIWAGNLDGTLTKQLTNDKASDTEPKWGNVPVDAEPTLNPVTPPKPTSTGSSASAGLTPDDGREVVSGTGPAISADGRLLLSMRVTRAQRVLRRHVVTGVAKCSEACTITAAARAVIRPAKGHKGAVKVLRVTKVQATAGANQRLTLRLKVKGKALRALRKAFAARKRITIVVDLTAKDAENRLTPHIIRKVAIKR